jgi:tetratricopeptide (TPR) repeat protein
MIERALKARPQPLARARLEQLKGRTLMNGPRPLEGYELLVTEARAVERADAALAARMLADAACAAIVGGDSSLSVLAIRRAKRLAAGDTVTQAAVAAAGLATTLLGAASKADLRLSPSEGGDDLESLQTLQRAASALMWRERHEEAARLLERLVDLGRAGRARVLLPTALDTLAAIDYRAGRWPRAAARSKEALRLARRMGLRFEGASSLTTTARLAAARGDEEEARTLLAEAIAFATDHRHVRTYAATAMGLLELGLGRIGSRFSNAQPTPVPDRGRARRWQDALGCYRRRPRLMTISTRPSPLTCEAPCHLSALVPSCCTASVYAESVAPQPRGPTCARRSPLSSGSGRGHGQSERGASSASGRRDRNQGQTSRLTSSTWRLSFSAG